MKMTCRAALMEISKTNPASIGLSFSEINNKKKKANKVPTVEK